MKNWKVEYLGWSSKNKIAVEVTRFKLVESDLNLDFDV